MHTTNNEIQNVIIVNKLTKITKISWKIHQRKVF